MIFALGFLAAGLLTLLFLPAVWRRAMRLSTRRLEMQLPLSVGEIVAERDQLRAEFAVTRRRIEQKYEALQEVHAGDFAELGRRAGKMAELAVQVDGLSGDVARLERSGAATSASLAEARAEAGGLHGALHQSDGLRERREEQLRGLENACQILQITSGQQQVALYELDSRHSLTLLSLKNTEHSLDAASRELAQRRVEIGVLTSERDHARAQTVFYTQRRDVLQGELTALGEKHATIETSLAEARAQIAAGAREAARRGELAAASEQQILDIVARHKGALERGGRALEIALTNEREAARRLEVARGENAATEGALQAGRDERARLQRELSLLQAGEPYRPRAGQSQGAANAEPDDEAQLRRSISDLADRLLRLSAMAPPNPAATPPAIAMQQLRARPKKPVDKMPASAGPPVA